METLSYIVQWQHSLVKEQTYGKVCMKITKHQTDISECLDFFVCSNFFADLCTCCAQEEASFEVEAPVAIPEKLKRSQLATAELGVHRLQDQVKHPAFRQKE